jgi:hypothetical protein
VDRHPGDLKPRPTTHQPLAGTALILEGLAAPPVRTESLNRESPDCKAYCVIQGNVHNILLVTEMVHRKKIIGTAKQIAAFKETARALGCDESEAHFDANLEKVARASIPRKIAKRAATGKPLKIKKTDKPSVPAKKKIRFNLPGA